MGSLCEEDLEKLVIDYIESSPITVSDHINKSSTALTNLQEILEERIEEENEIEEKIDSFIKREGLLYQRDDEKRDVLKKIVSMLKSEGYNALFSKTSWDSSFDPREGSRVFRCNRKYEFIDVMMKYDHEGDEVGRVIVDLDFKSQFELAKPTESYKDMTEMLPRVFVATEERLRRVVLLVCGEMKKSMKEKGMSRPMWRTSKYMLAKWLLLENRRLKKESWSVFDDDAGVVENSGSKTKCCFPIF